MDSSAAKGCCCATCRRSTGRWPRRCPLAARTEEVMDILAHFRTLLRDVDSSLIEEWESMTQPGQPRAGKAPSRQAVDPAAERRALHAAIRAELHSWCARSRVATTRRRCASLAPGAGESWTMERLTAAMAPVLGRTHRAADHAGRAPARSHAHRPAGRGPPARSADAGRRARATRTGRSTASSTCSRPADRRRSSCSASASDAGASVGVQRSTMMGAPGRRSAGAPTITSSPTRRPSVTSASSGK